MDEEASAVRARRRRPSWRWLLGVPAAILAGAAVAGYLVLANVYMPLTEGSSTGPDSAYPGSLFLRTVEDPFGTGSQWVYCSVPSGRFAWMMSLANQGSLPVTILGGGHPPGWMPGMTGGGMFWLVDLATAWPPVASGVPATEMNRINVDSAPTDPRTVAAMSPTVLAPSDEIDLWARYQMGSQPMADGGRTWQRSVWVRYSVLGIERTVEVSLRDGPGTQSGGCPSPSPASGAGPTPGATTAP